jgi:tetratricopeptide (TPR) repeat protein
MDALKKAELAKRQGRNSSDETSGNDASVGGLSLEPLPVIAESSIAPTETNQSTNASSALPDLPTHLETLDERFPVETPAPSPPLTSRQAAPSPTPTFAAAPVITPAREPQNTRPVIEDPLLTRQQTGKAIRPEAPEVKDFKAQMEQSAAQNLFAAKQTEKPASNKSFAIAIGVVTLLSAAGIGGYFWWQLQPKSSLGVGNIAVRTPPPTSQAPVAAPANVAPIPPATTVSPVAPTTAAGTVPAGSKTASDDEDEDAGDSPKKPAQRARQTASRVAPEADSDSLVRVTRAPLKVNPALAKGFDAFNRGDFSTAQSEYDRVLKSEPRNVDALHGLAAIATRQGKAEQADWYYQRLLEADPRDAVAMANLINSKSQIDPVAAESRLKVLTAEQPELAAPHFSLGNLYAKQSRWNEAQQAYFRAYGADPENADILYNLAISLEHLRQNKLASQYYSLALTAAKSRPGAFDPEQAASRLRALQP